MDALDAEPQRIAEGWAPLYHYQNMGFYGEQLSRFYKQFSPEQLKVFLYEDLETEPKRVVREIYEFIGVDAAFEPDTKTRHNISGVPQNKLMHQAHRFLKKTKPAQGLWQGAVTRSPEEPSETAGFVTPRDSKLA